MFPDLSDPRVWLTGIGLVLVVVAVVFLFVFLSFLNLWIQCVLTRADISILAMIRMKLTKIDPAMPCFRLGALGTELQRHKRVNGLFPCIFATEPAGEILLGEAVRRLESAGLTYIAAQTPSNEPGLVAFYDRYLRRQGSFPILGRDVGRH